jgi:hypothetical protein
MKLQRLGGYAAIAHACVSIIFIAFFIIRLQRFGDLEDPVNAMAAISSSPVYFYFSEYLLIVCGILFLIVILALFERMKADSPNLTLLALIAASVSTAEGIFMVVADFYVFEHIAATNDISAYRAIDAITKSLWDASGHAIGWVGLLIGSAVLKTRAFPKTPALLFFLMGVFWVLMPIPINFGILAIIPWLSFFVGTLWFGIAMLRQKQPYPAGN